MKIKTAAASLLALTSWLSTSHAQLIGYEGFDTVFGINSGVNADTKGVTGSGFSAYGATDFRYKVADGLGYTDGFGNSLVTTGNLQKG